MSLMAGNYRQHAKAKDSDFNGFLIVSPDPLQPFAFDKHE